MPPHDEVTFYTPSMDKPVQLKWPWSFRMPQFLRQEKRTTPSQSSVLQGVAFGTAAYYFKQREDAVSNSLQEIKVELKQREEYVCNSLLELKSELKTEVKDLRSEMREAAKESRAEVRDVNAQLHSLSTAVAAQSGVANNRGRSTRT